MGREEGQVLTRHWRAAVLSVAAPALLGLGGSAAAEYGPPGATHLVSRPTGLGAPPAPTTNNSYGAEVAPYPGFPYLSRRTISGDGTKVVFSSDADGLSTADDNRYRNIYIRDLTTNTTTLVSRADGASGAAANGDSYMPTISSDGTQVAFVTSATNLAGDDTNNSDDVYVRDVVNNTTTLVNRGAPGIGQLESLYPSVTVAGAKVLVVFATYSALDAGDTGFHMDVYLRNVTDSTTTLVSRPDGITSTPGDSDSFEPDISADGTTVAFTSDATNLVTGDTNGKRDVFVRVLGTNATTLVSRATGATGAIGNDYSRTPSISADGTKIAFVSGASNFDAAHIGGAFEVYVRDTAANTTTLVSRRHGPTGADGPYDYQPSISGDGTKVAFVGFGANLDPAATSGPFVNYQIYIRTLATGATNVASRTEGTVTQADDASSSPSLDTDGGKVVFASKADNLSTADDNDFSNIFVRDMTGDHNFLASRPSGTSAFPGNGVNSSNAQPQNGVSADGRYVLFSSQADNLSTNDNNRFQNVFVRDTLTNTTTLVSRADNGDAVNGDSWAGGISADGTRVSFASDGDNLVPGVGQSEYYVRTLHSDPTLDHTLAATGPNNYSSQPQPGSDGSSLPNGDGTMVAFETQYPYDSTSDTTPNTRDIYVRNLNVADDYTLVDRATGPTGTLGSGYSTELRAFSRDGTKVVFETDVGLDPADTNGTIDVYVRDIVNNTTQLVSRADGTGSAVGSSNSSGGGISDDGNRVAFYSNSDNLVGGVADYGRTYVRDLSNDTTILVSRATGGTPANDKSWPYGTSISGDGNKVAFSSTASNLAAGADGSAFQVYVRNISANTTTLASNANGSATPANAPATNANISRNGDCVVFGSNADNLIGGYAGGLDFSNVYEHTVSHECPIDFPQTTIGSGPSSVSNTRSPTFTFSSDEAGSTFECRVDGAAFAACSSPYTTGSLAEGSHSFAVRATDPGGYVDASPAARTWSIDVTSPQTTITSSPLGPTRTRRATFTFNSTEAGSTFRCSRDGAAFLACSSPRSYTGFPDGSHTFSVEATDAAGNTDSSPATQVWDVDGTAPKPSLVVPKQKLARVLAKGLKLRVGTSEASLFRVVVKIGKKKFGTAVGQFARAGRKFAVVKPTPAAKKALKRARSAKLTILLTETDALGNTSRRVTRRVKFKR